MYDALGGGVTRSLSLDTHGKSLSSLLLDMEIDVQSAGADNSRADVKGGKNASD